jgi:GNAT superfamily N-acetyltransferase
VEFIELPPCARPLLDKFYKLQSSRMRSVGNARWWVARSGEIVAGSNFLPVAGGHWLTGLHVAVDQRNKGLGRRLLSAAQTTLGGPVWLFCEPPLRGFYLSLGFEDATTLPAELTQRLQRYRASKNLLALVRPMAA